MLKGDVLLLVILVPYAWHKKLNWLLFYILLFWVAKKGPSSQDIRTIKLYTKNAKAVDFSRPQIDSTLSEAFLSCSARSQVVFEKSNGFCQSCIVQYNMHTASGQARAQVSLQGNRNEKRLRRARRAALLVTKPALIVAISPVPL